MIASISRRGLGAFTVLILLANGTAPSWMSTSAIEGQSSPVVLQGGRILTVSGPVIEEGSLVMEGGRITAVGAEVRVPPGARVIDVSGKVVMPGLLDGFTNLGAADYPSFGQDADEATGAVLPQLRIVDGLNPANRFLSAARGSGVTAALSAPSSGNLITGQSALIHLTGATVEEMVLASPVGVHVTLGEGPKARYGTKNQAPMTRMGSAALLRQTLVDASAYAEKVRRYQEQKEAFADGTRDEEPAPLSRDLKEEALVPVIRGELPLIIAADRYDDILTALRITAEFKVSMVLLGGAEAHRLADELARRAIPVIWGPSGAANRELEASRGTPETPGMLTAAGIRVAFQTGGIENVGGLLLEARTAYAAGLPHDETLKALTLYPALIFGIADDLGSLETGKAANVAVFDADPLDSPASAELVFVQGIEVVGSGG